MTQDISFDDFKLGTRVRIAYDAKVCKPDHRTIQSQREAGIVIKKHVFADLAIKWDGEHGTTTISHRLLEILNPEAPKEVLMAKPIKPAFTIATVQLKLDVDDIITQVDSLLDELAEFGFTKKQARKIAARFVGQLEYPAFPSPRPPHGPSGVSQTQ